MFKICYENGERLNKKTDVAGKVLLKPKVLYNKTIKNLEEFSYYVNHRVYRQRQEY